MDSSGYVKDGWQAGLWRITTCTATFTGGTAGSVSSSGVVTIGSANTAVTISDAFSANFESYRVVVEGIDCSTQDLAFNMQMGTTAAGYYANLKYYKIGTGNGDLPLNNDSLWYIGVTDTFNTCFTFDLHAPYVARRTYFASQGYGYLSSYTASGMLANTTSYTAFKLYPNAGTMTGGTIRVYGYNL
jgi:hypothetical protein